jgi:hypothetical protein
MEAFEKLLLLAPEFWSSAYVLALLQANVMFLFCNYFPLNKITINPSKSWELETSVKILKAAQFKRRTAYLHT